MFKKIILLSIILIVLISGLYIFGVYKNNRDVLLPENTELKQRLEKSIIWLVNHEDKIVTQTNPMLWWMLYEVQKISPDARIEKLLQVYFERNKRIKSSLWGPLFDGEQYNRLAGYSVTGLPYYNQHFIYALNCAGEIAEDLRIVEQQNESSFCFQTNFIYRPACITHQLMGINFLVTKKCNLLPAIDKVSKSLQQSLVSQLSWDIRVVDVYLQRVLMLLITGAENDIKPVWIRQVMDQQLADGGWGNFDTLVSIGNGKSLGFSPRILSLGEEKSSFHATAQGLYILAYLISQGVLDNKTGDDSLAE